MHVKIMQKFIDSWPAPYVAREEVYRFSGGIVSPKTLANADSNGTGPSIKMRFGKRKVAYPTSELAKWLAEKFSNLNTEGTPHG